MSDKCSRRLWIFVMVLVQWSSTVWAADAEHPLKPQILSSPGATLNAFLTTGDALHTLLRDEYWNAPGPASCGVTDGV